MSDETPETPEETPVEQPEAAQEVASEETAAPAEESAEAPVAEAEAAEEPVAVADEADEAVEAEAEEEEEAPAPREKPAIPGMDLEVDLVLEDEGVQDPWAEHDAAEADEDAGDEDEDDDLAEPITAQIQLSADARYSATGKRKRAIARVTLKPGTGQYTINGRELAEFFPRDTLQRNIRQPLEAVGFEDKMDVVARMNGGGVSAQAGALRHGISRALLEADPNLRSELKKRGFLTRDARAKERKKAGLKKARKRPQFSKR